MKLSISGLTGKFPVSSFQFRVSSFEFPVSGGLQGFDCFSISVKMEKFVTIPAGVFNVSIFIMYYGRKFFATKAPRHQGSRII